MGTRTRVGRALVLAGLLAAFGAAAAGEIYEWTDASGRKQFTSDLSHVPPGQRAAAEAKARARGATQPAPPAAAAPETSPASDATLRRAHHTAQAAALLRERLIEPGGAARWNLDLGKPVQAVLMETGYDRGAATLIAFENGAASLYLSTGGGVIGGESIPAVRAAAIRLCEKAQATLATAAPSPGAPPLPRDGEVQFLIVSPGGLRMLRTTRAAAQDPASPHRALFLAGHEVLTGLREASQARGIQP